MSETLNAKRTAAVAGAATCSAHWRDISTLDRTTMDFVLVTEDGAVRLHLWNPHRNYWERAYPIGSIVQDGQDCSNPTHWMPCPNAPNAPLQASGADDARKTK